MRRRIALAPAIVFLFTLSATACEDPVPVPSTLEKVSGDSQEGEVATALSEALVVRVLDQNGEPMSGVAVEWEAAAGSVTGGTTSEGDGTASATWTLGTEAGEQTVTASLGATTSASFTATALAGDVAALTVTPEELALGAIGETGALAAAGADAHGNAVDVTVTWTSRDEAVAEVDAEGNVEATGNGETWVVASSEGVSDSARVVVEQEPSSVAVTPAEATVHVGASVLLEAAAVDANGNTVTTATFTWTALDAEVATVDADGLVQGVAAGTARIVASVAELADTAEVTVEAASGIDLDLVGEWVETSLTYENQADAGQVVEVADDDYLAMLTLRADGSLSLRELQGSGDDTDHGTWSVIADTLLVDIPADDTVYTFPYTADGDTFSFTVLEDEGYDFNDDGVYEATITSSAWSRRMDLPGLVGSWSSESVVAVNVDDASQTADLSADLSFHITFGSDGSHSLSEEGPDGAESEAGWFVTAGASLWFVEPEGSVARVGLALVEDTATITFVEDGFDFEDDGFPETAEITIRLLRSTGGVTGDVDPDLVGEWVGISYVLQNQDASQQVDVVVEQGWLMEMNLNQDGTWSYLETYTDGDIGWHDAGSWYTRNDTIILYSGREQDSLHVPYTKPEPDVFSYTTEGEEDWDFNGDGVDETTGTETAILARRIDGELVGTWEAESMVMADANDETRWVDAIAEGGSLTATLYSDGSITIEQVEPDLNDQWYLDGQVYTFAARYAAAEPFLWVVDSDGTEQLVITLDGDQLTVVTEYDVDIDGDGIEEPVIETTQLRRQ